MCRKLQQSINALAKKASAPSRHSAVSSLYPISKQNTHQQALQGQAQEQKRTQQERIEQEIDGADVIKMRQSQPDNNNIINYELNQQPQLQQPYIEQPVPQQQPVPPQQQPKKAIYSQPSTPSLQAAQNPPPHPLPPRQQLYVQGQVAKIKFSSPSTKTNYATPLNQVNGATSRYLINGGPPPHMVNGPAPHPRMASNSPQPRGPTMVPNYHQAQRIINKSPEVQQQIQGQQQHVQGQ